MKRAYSFIVLLVLVACGGGGNTEMNDAVTQNTNGASAFAGDVRPATSETENVPK